MRILRELADRETVAATAAALSMTPSAVSQQLKVLGREAGVPLLEPDGRRLRFTDAGRALVVRADEVLDALDRATDEMAAYARSPRGRVRVASFPSGAALLLPAVLEAAEAIGVELDVSDEDVPASAAPALLADYDVVLTHRDERSAPLSGPRVHVETLCANRSMSSSRRSTGSRRRTACRSTNWWGRAGSACGVDSPSTTCCSPSRR